MKTAIANVTAFHTAAEQPVVRSPRIPLPNRVELRKSLVREEVGELLIAIDDENLVEIADGIADSIVVLIGTALEYGIPLDEVWREIHASNMAKFPKCTACDGLGVFCKVCNERGTQLIRRADGKVLKPRDWVPPDVGGVLATAMARGDS